MRCAGLRIWLRGGRGDGRPSGAGDAFEASRATRAVPRVSRRPPAGRDQIRDETLVDVQIAFVFPEIASVMALGGIRAEIHAQPVGADDQVVQQRGCDHLGGASTVQLTSCRHGKIPIAAQALISNVGCP